jgi:predicted esterase
MEGLAFARLKRSVLADYQQQHYAQALALVNEALTALPAQRPRLLYWRACLTARLGERAEALASLAAALAEGAWFSRSELQDEALTPLQDDPDYRQLLQICGEREAAARAQAQPTLYLRKPSTMDPPCALLLALHGNQSSVREEGAYWEAAVHVGWLLALPQSSQLVSCDRASWTAWSQARQEVERHWEQLRREYVLDEQRLVLAGFSRGAALAIALALSGACPATGFVAVCPALRPEELPTPQPTCRVRRGYILVGELDPGWAASLTLVAALRQTGIACQLLSYPTLGHDFPPTFPSQLAGLLTNCTAVNGC